MIIILLFQFIAFVFFISYLFVAIIELKAKKISGLLCFANAMACLYLMHWIGETFQGALK
ncbi:hypothetical protein UFOVP581_38 [uncultured Caudovirales phage]|uniref:Uncharacterized protein n=1 Tax=uncultured Caudovirales phage TaxID=2100421 RepID=A0A6J5PN80_9CAUD|nr:hypothetical protein UFOVP581_38 [uncultured Caudovirales phage]